MDKKGKQEGKEYVLKMAREHNVKFVELWFTDIRGMLKSYAIPVSELEGAIDSGMGFDGSSVEGYSRIDESDMMSVPDLDTFQLLPWKVREDVPLARMFCDIRQPSGEAFEGDPRQVLKRNLKKATELGFTYYVGPELEYFYFKDDKKTEGLDEGGYYDMTLRDAASELRNETVLALEEMGIGVDKSHHEVARSQHEIDMRYTDALTMADQVMTYRLVVKEIAARKGWYASFMPKPIFGINGSGMHVHQSLFKNGKNAFFDKNGLFHLSKAAQSFVAGLLKYAPEFTAVTNQWVNSYKRLVPGYEAPVYLSWAIRNRSDLVRVPGYEPGKENATRFEIRSPDPACNPYLEGCVSISRAARHGLPNHLFKALVLPAAALQGVTDASEAFGGKAGRLGFHNGDFAGNGKREELGHEDRLLQVVAAAVGDRDAARLGPYVIDRGDGEWFAALSR